MVTDLPGDCTQLLALQHGVIARWQAPAIGVSPSTIDRLLRYGRWRHLYRGVYAAYTGTPPREGLLWAGVLRAGPGAALSHHTAGELDGLTDGPSSVIHVTVSHDRRVQVSRQERHQLAPPIVVHRCDRIDAMRHPARTPPRTRIEETVLDLTQLSGRFDVAFSWLSRACGRRLVTPHALRAAADQRGRLRWRDDILGALPLIADGVHSNLEYRYVRDVEHGHSLPAAKRQARMTRGSSRPRSQYLDNLYAPFGVVVELDGHAAHAVEDRWQDIHRDNSNARSGLITLRYSWADVTYRPCQVAAEIYEVLRRRGWEGVASYCGPCCSVRVPSTGTNFSA